MNHIDDVKGGCIGFRFKDRGDFHISITMLVEDDGIWHEQDVEFSSFWLDDLIVVAGEAKQRLESQAVKSPCGYGYSFNTEEPNPMTTPLTPTPSDAPLCRMPSEEQEKELRTMLTLFVPDPDHRIRLWTWIGSLLESRRAVVDVEQLVHECFAIVLSNRRKTTKNRRKEMAEAITAALGVKAGEDKDND